MRKVIRQIIIEQIENERILKEADMMAMGDIMQTLWNLASAGFITYQFAKQIYNSYKSGKASKEEVQDIIRDVSIDFLKNGETEDLDFLDKTVPSPYPRFDDAVLDALDDDDYTELDLRRIMPEEESETEDDDRLFDFETVEDTLPMNRPEDTLPVNRPDNTMPLRRKR